MWDSVCSGNEDDFLSEKLAVSAFYLADVSFGTLLSVIKEKRRKKKEERKQPVITGIKKFTGADKHLTYLLLNLSL